MTEGMAGLRLRVEGARKRDAGRGIARLPGDVQSRLGVLSGDPVIIEGDRLTVAKVWPGEDEGSVVRIDADTRASAGVNVGDDVRVRKATVEDAVSITLQPADEHADEGASEAGLHQRLVDRLLRPGKRVRVEGYGAYVVTGARPSGSVRVTSGTDVNLESEIADDGARESAGESGHDAAQTGATYEDIGGLDRELDLVREMIELPLSEPELFTRLGIDPPKGVLLYGPPGTGKTLIARAVANEVDAYFDAISGPEIVSKYKGESEQRLREAFESAEANAPAILFVDEIDSIAGARDDEADMENRVVAQLLTLMDGLDERKEVVVIGATNRVDAVDPALRRGGRFDREIEIGVPGETGRREILDVHTRNMPFAEDVELDAIAARTHGFVGADLASLVREAGMSALRRDPDELEVARRDFDHAANAVEPSAMREYVSESPTEDFASVGGLADTKERLRETVEWPLSYGPLFEAARTTPPSGVLLYGPSGTGKTLLARAIAGESGVNFVSVAGPEVLDRYVGKSEEAIRDLFERARQTAPAIVFIDEVDAIGASRADGHEVTQRVVSQLLAELDRVADHPSVVVLAATNRKEALDPALLRPGRLERHLEMPFPDEATRREILAVHATDRPLADDVDLDEVAADTADYSGADIEALLREASLRAIREVAENIDPSAAEDRATDVLIRERHVVAAREAMDVQ